MTPKEQKILTQSIQANRRALSLLDRRIDDLLKTYPSVLEDYDTEDRQPFYYGAVGVDGQMGIPFTAANVGENPAFGYVRTHPDTAFVLTGINVAVSRTSTAVGVTTTITSATSDSSDGARGFMMGLRIYDESSSRWITFTNQNNEPQQKATFPTASFSAYSAYNQGGFAMTTECVFPRSAVLRVEVYAQNPSRFGVAPPESQRLQAVFAGYKVYGG